MSVAWFMLSAFCLGVAVALGAAGLWIYRFNQEAMEKTALADARAEIIADLKKNAVYLNHRIEMLEEELAKRMDDLVAMKRDGFRSPTARERGAAEEEPWPQQVLAVLSRFPAELRGDQEVWIREQRRHGAPWHVIYRHLTGGQEMPEESAA